MTRTQIVEELKSLSVNDRLAVVEAALRLIRQDLQQGQTLSRGSQKKRQLADAAQLLLADYSSNDELTAFTVLDSEDFYAAG